MVRCTHCQMKQRKEHLKQSINGKLNVVSQDEDRPAIKLTTFNAQMKTFLTKENQLDLLDDAEELEDYLLTSKYLKFSYTDDMIISTMALSQDYTATTASTNTASATNTSVTSASTEVSSHLF